MKILRPMGFCQLLCVLAVLGYGCQTSPRASKKPTPVTDADILGTWVGLTEDGLDYFRLDLRPGGEGLCAYAYVHNKARLLEVASWSTQAGKILIGLRPVDNDPNGVTKMEGTAHTTVMDLKVVGQGWQRGLVMRREEDLERRVDLVKTRMERYKAEVGASQDADR